MVKSNAVETVVDPFDELEEVAPPPEPLVASPPAEEVATPVGIPTDTVGGGPTTDHPEPLYPGVTVSGTTRDARPGAAVQLPPYDLPPVAQVEAPETPEAKRARLLAELAELNKLDPTPPDPQPGTVAARLAEVEEEARRQAHDAAIAQGRDDPSATLDQTVAAPGTQVVLIHFLEDGFTALGNVWRRGQELEFVVPSEAHDATKNRFGVSWLDLAYDEMSQSRKYGKVLFRLGPWPGAPWPDDVAGQAERTRSRKPPIPPRIIRRAP